MDKNAGREDHGNANGPTRLVSPHSMVDLVRLLARIAAERDYREARVAIDPPDAGWHDKGDA